MSSGTNNVYHHNSRDGFSLGSSNSSCGNSVSFTVVNNNYSSSNRDGSEQRDGEGVSTAQEGQTAKKDKVVTRTSDGFVVLPESLLDKVSKAKCMSEEHVIKHLEYLPYLSEKYAHHIKEGTTPANRKDNIEAMADAISLLYSQMYEVGRQVTKSELAIRFGNFMDKNASQYLKHKKENRDYQFNDVKNFLLDLSTDKSSEDPFYFHRVTYDLFHSIAADEAAEFQKGAIVDGIQHFLEPKQQCIILIRQASSRGRNKSHSFLKVAVRGSNEVRDGIKAIEEKTGMVVSRAKRDASSKQPSTPTDHCDNDPNGNQGDRKFFYIPFSPALPKKAYLKLAVNKISALMECDNTPDQNQLKRMLIDQRRIEQRTSKPLTEEVDELVASAIEKKVDQTQLCRIIAEAYHNRLNGQKGIDLYQRFDDKDLSIGLPEDDFTLLSTDHDFFEKDEMMKMDPLTSPQHRVQNVQVPNASLNLPPTTYSTQQQLPPPQSQYPQESRSSHPLLPPPVQNTQQQLPPPPPPKQSSTQQQQNRNPLDHFNVIPQKEENKSGGDDNKSSAYDMQSDVGTNSNEEEEEELEDDQGYPTKIVRHEMTDGVLKFVCEWHEADRLYYTDAFEMKENNDNLLEKYIARLKRKMTTKADARQITDYFKTAGCNMVQLSC